MAAHTQKHDLASSTDHENSGSDGEVLRSNGSGGQAWSNSAPQTIVMAYELLLDQTVASMSKGQMGFNAGDYPVSMSFKFNCVGWLGGTGGNQSATVKLKNVTDAEYVTGASLSITNTDTSETEFRSSALTVGSGAGNLKDTRKIYEVEVLGSNLDDTTDFVQVGTAYITVE